MVGELHTYFVHDGFIDNSLGSCCGCSADDCGLSCSAGGLEDLQCIGRCIDFSSVLCRECTLVELWCNGPLLVYRLDHMSYLCLLNFSVNYRLDN